MKFLILETNKLISYAIDEGNFVEYETALSHVGLNKKSTSLK
jgi:hypothetical protein